MKMIVLLFTNRCMSIQLHRLCKSTDTVMPMDVLGQLWAKWSSSLKDGGCSLKGLGEAAISPWPVYHIVLPQYGSNGVIFLTQVLTQVLPNFARVQLLSLFLTFFFFSFWSFTVWFLEPTALTASTIHSHSVSCLLLFMPNIFPGSNFRKKCLEIIRGEISLFVPLAFVIFFVWMSMPVHTLHHIQISVLEGRGRAMCCALNFTLIDLRCTKRMSVSTV